MGLIRRLLGRRLAPQPIEPIEDPPFIYEPDPRGERGGRVLNTVYAKMRTGKVWHRIHLIGYAWVGDPSPWLSGHRRSFTFACFDGTNDNHATGGTTADPRFAPTPIRTDVPPRSETCRSCLREDSRRDREANRR